MVAPVAVIPDVPSKKALIGLKSKNKYGIDAKMPAKIQLKVTAQRPSPFLISFIDFICDTPGMSFLRVTEIINALAPAIRKGKTALDSP